MQLASPDARGGEKCRGAATPPPNHSSRLGSQVVGHARGSGPERGGVHFGRRRAPLVARLGRKRAPVGRAATRRRAGGEPPPFAVSGRPEPRGGWLRRNKEERVPKDQIDFFKPASSVALRVCLLLDIIGDMQVVAWPLFLFAP